MEFVMRPIGKIHSPFNDKRDTPIQPSRSTALRFIWSWPSKTDSEDQFSNERKSKHVP